MWRGPCRGKRRLPARRCQTLPWMNDAPSEGSRDAAQSGGAAERTPVRPRARGLQPRGPAAGRPKRDSPAKARERWAREACSPRETEPSEGSCPPLTAGVAPSGGAAGKTLTRPRVRGPQPREPAEGLLRRGFRAEEKTRPTREACKPHESERSGGSCPPRFAALSADAAQEEVGKRDRALPLPPSASALLPCGLRSLRRLGAEGKAQSAGCSPGSLVAPTHRQTRRRGGSPATCQHEGRNRGSRRRPHLAADLQ